MGPTTNTGSGVTHAYHVGHCIMTSSNGNIFRVTGPLCGEFTGYWWIPLSKTSDAELWYFLWSASWINNREADDLRRHRAHDDVIVMCFGFGRSNTLLSRLHHWRWGYHTVAPVSIQLNWRVCIYQLYESNDWKHNHNKTKHNKSMCILYMECAVLPTARF